MSSRNPSSPGLRAKVLQRLWRRDAAGAPYERAIFTAGAYDLPCHFYAQAKDGGSCDLGMPSVASFAARVYPIEVASMAG
jgi:hypothetical protein